MEEKNENKSKKKSSSFVPYLIVFILGLSIINITFYGISITQTNGNLTIYPGVIFAFPQYVNLTFASPLTFSGSFNITSGVITYEGVYIKMAKTSLTYPSVNLSLLSYFKGAASDIQIWKFNINVPTNAANFIVTLVSGNTFFGSYSIDGNVISTGAISSMEFNVQSSVSNRSMEIRVNPITIGELDLSVVWNGFILLVFVAIVVLFFIVAFWIRKHRGGIT